MRVRQFISIASVTLVLSSPAAASDDAQSFIEHQHAKLERLLREPTSTNREAQINEALDGFVDYSELTRRAFGEPCPAGVGVEVAHAAM